MFRDEATEPAEELHVEQRGGVARSLDFEASTEELEVASTDQAKYTHGSTHNWGDDDSFYSGMSLAEVASEAKSMKDEIPISFSKLTSLDVSRLLFAGKTNSLMVCLSYIPYVT